MSINGKTAERVRYVSKRLLEVGVLRTKAECKAAWHVKDRRWLQILAMARRRIESAAVFDERLAKGLLVTRLEHLYTEAKTIRDKLAVLSAMAEMLGLYAQPKRVNVTRVTGNKRTMDRMLQALVDAEASNPPAVALPAPAKPGLRQQPRPRWTGKDTTKRQTVQQR